VNALRKVRIWRSTPEGAAAEVIDAGPTPVPGLVIGYFRWSINPGWQVIHEASGFGVASAENPEHALAIAAALDGLTDWLRPARDLQRDRSLSKAVTAAVERTGGWFRGPLASAEMVAAAEGGAP
jgi:hypothetical protein